MKVRVFWVAMAMALAMSIGACSKGGGIQAACEKVAEADEVADCVAELTRELEECSNKDDIIECLGGAETENAAEACLGACEVAESE